MDSTANTNQTPIVEPPNSPVPTVVLWVLCVLSFVAVVVSNQFAGKAEPESTTVEVLPPDMTNELALQTKLGVKLGSLAGQQALYATSVQAALAKSTSNADHLRGAVSLAEFSGPEAGLKQLEAFMARELKPGEEALAVDGRLLKQVLSDPPVALSDAEMVGLRERHGFFADLAVSRGKPSTDPVRAELESGGVQIILVAIAAGGAALLGFFGAIAGVVVMVMQVTKKNFRFAFVRPSGGASTLFLEAFLLFLGGFAILHIGFPLVLSAAGVLKPGVAPPAWQMAVTLLLQWSLLLTIFWPLVRGVSWEQWKQATGWHSGKGLWREIGAALVGYAAMLPFLVLVMALLAVYIMWRQAQDPGAAPPSNPVAELVAGAGWVELLLVFALMTIWAPVVEETFFRGMLYRHLRGRMGVLLATVISALWFGFMHGYSGILLMPVITIGAGFALMREWRGSLLPVVIAHAIHNFMIGSLAIGFFTALK
jgi:membrane protease YdiL (CAAX protease family)